MNNTSKICITVIAVTIVSMLKDPMVEIVKSAHEQHMKKNGFIRLHQSEGDLNTQTWLKEDEVGERVFTLE